MDANADNSRATVRVSIQKQKLEEREKKKEIVLIAMSAAVILAEHHTCIIYTCNFNQGNCFRLISLFCINLECSRPFIAMCCCPYLTLCYVSLLVANVAYSIFSGSTLSRAIKDQVQRVLCCCQFLVHQRVDTVFLN